MKIKLLKLKKSNLYVFTPQNMSTAQLCRVCLQANESEMVSLFTTIGELTNMGTKSLNELNDRQSIAEVTINEVIESFSPKEVC